MSSPRNAPICLPLQRVYRFYRDGFKSMRLGRTLWKIIFIKLVVMFAVLKVFFFPDVLHTRFATDSERADHVLQNLTRWPQAAQPMHQGGPRD